MFTNLNDIVFQITKLHILSFVAVFLCLISFIACLLVFIDKKLAIYNKSRISEKTLFIFAFLGGAFAEFFIMILVRHKTLHKRFMIGLPLIFTVQTGLLVWWVVKWF